MNKNITFFLVLSFFSAIFSTENNTKTCTFEYTVSPKDFNDHNDFNNTTKQLLSLFDDIHRNPENNTTFYDKLLAFIKEVQEAIIAGVNLLSTSSSSANETIATINEVAQTAEEIIQTVEAVQANIAQDAQAKTIETVEVNEEASTSTTNAIETVEAEAVKAIEIPKIKIIITISCDNEEKETLFEELKNKMNALADAVNGQTCTAEDFVTTLNTIIQESKQLEFAGNISINIQG